MLVNPRFLVGVLGIICDDQGRVLLLNHERYRRIHPWGLPGGWHKPGETICQTIRREIKEEMNLTVQTDSFFHLISSFDIPRLEFFVIGKITGGQPKLNEEISEYRFIEADSDYTMILPRHRKVLEFYFKKDSSRFESSFAMLEPSDPGV